MTESQRLAINNSIDDLRSTKPMRRIISGDVGSGKSVVQYCCAAATQMSGYQAAVMTPNGQLARQLFNQFKEYYPDVPVHYLGGLTGRKSVDLSSKPVLIGTTAVMHFVERNNVELDLIMLDEQQKAGQEQKDSLLAPHTNFMELSATPIPKSMALLLFANTSVSQIFPHCTKDIRSLIVNTSKKADMFRKVRSVIAGGGKASIVFSKIEADTVDDGEDDTAEERAPRKALMEAKDQWEALFPGRVAVLHGRLKEKERITELERFERGEADVLLTTTVIEIGINIPRLELMVVHNPEALGASQLHQLRGRLTRHGEATGWFFMYVENALPKSTIKRLVSVRETNDGFELANKDLELRGFGDVIGGGTRQHGRTIGLFRNRDINPKSLEPYLQSLARTGGFAEALERVKPDFEPESAY
tara:strand:+ start:1166 stop:2416 length:1251 start_codon:yes stop_codon:yes gene_type:complete